MAEEFADFMEKLKQEPIEEQLLKLRDVVSILVDLVEKFVDKYTMEFSAIQNKILSLETKQMNVKLPKIDKLALSPPPSPPQIRPLGDENIRITVLNEIKELFKKKE